MSVNQQVTTLDFLRHGDCEDGMILRGHTDSPLSEKGWQQMHTATAQQRWQKIICSPLQRCQGFAEKIAAQQGVTATPMTSLKEISFGDWDGMTIDELEKKQPQGLQSFLQNPLSMTPPNAETLIDFHQRVNDALTQIVETARNQQCLIVTHGGVIRSVLAHILSMPLQSLPTLAISHACMSQIKIYHHADHPDWFQFTQHRPLPEHTYVS